MASDAPQNATPPQAAPVEAQAATQPAANDNAAPQAPANDNAAQTGAETLQQAVDDGVLAPEDLARLHAGKKIRLKLYGRERLVGMEQAARFLQQGVAGTEALEKVAQERKALEAEKAQLQERSQAQLRGLFQALATDPIGTFRELGMEEQFWAALERRAEFESLPEDKRKAHAFEQERARFEQERAAFEAERKAIEDAKRQEVQRVEDQKNAERIAQSWIGAMDGAGIPKDAKRRAMAFEYMKQQGARFIDAGEELPDPQWLAQDAKDWLDSLRREVAETVEPEDLPQEKLRRWEQQRVQALRDTQQPRSPAGQFAPRREAEKPAGPVRYGKSVDSWIEARRKAVKK